MAVLGLTEPQGMAALSPRSGVGWENDIGAAGTPEKLSPP